jgi:hypothetical protein
VLVTRRQQQGVEVRERHPQVLGLPAHVGAHRDVAIGPTGEALVDREAEPGLVVLAVLAEPAGDVEGQRDPVARAQLRDSGADLLDDAHVLVAEHDARLGAGASLVHVQVGAADGGRGHADHDIGGILDLRILHVLDGNVERFLVHDGFHGCAPTSV